MKVAYTVGPAIAAVEPVAPCCGDMDTAWGRFIGFGDETNQNAEVNLYRGVSAIPIHFCPFCGDKIETREQA